MATQYKIIKLIEAESRTVPDRGRGEEEMGRNIKGMKFQLCRINKFWRSNVWHGDYS